MKTFGELLKEGSIATFDYTTIAKGLKQEMQLCIGVWLRTGEYIPYHRDQLENFLIPKKFEDEMSDGDVGMYKSVKRITVEE